MQIKYEVVAQDVHSHEDLPNVGGDFTDRSEASKEADRIEESGDAIARVLTVIECCGNEMYAASFTNTCDVCGRDYNPSGQLLAARSQWGEETGEPWDAGDRGYNDPESAFEER